MVGCFSVVKQPLIITFQLLYIDRPPIITTVFISLACIPYQLKGSYKWDCSMCLIRQKVIELYIFQLLFSKLQLWVHPAYTKEHICVNYIYSQWEFFCEVLWNNICTMYEWPSRDKNSFCWWCFLQAMQAKIFVLFRAGVIFLNGWIRAMGIVTSASPLGMTASSLAFTW